VNDINQPAAAAAAGSQKGFCVYLISNYLKIIIP
jgi:hypothetical protein